MSMGHCGLSPRGRGNLARGWRSLAGMGLSRVGGEPLPLTHLLLPRWVYPRVGGGPRVRPHVGGGNRSIPAWAGEPCVVVLSPEVLRSIPAWAGEPIVIVRNTCMPAGLSRVGGGTPMERALEASITGLSPRGAGEPRTCTIMARWRYAVYPRVGGGTTYYAVVAKFSRAKWVYPRVGGGTGLPKLSTHSSRGLSPRGRGNHDAVP